MTTRLKVTALVFGVVFLAAVVLASMAEARRGGGRRGGGGFSRSSAARGGSFSSRSASRSAASRARVSHRQAPSSTGQSGRSYRSKSQAGQGERASQRDRKLHDAVADREGNREDAREDWQQHRKEMQEDRQDFYEDEWDDHWHGHYHYGGGAAFVTGVAVGASTVSVLTTLPCNAMAVTVNGVTYYQCGSTWYSRGYESNTVVYIVSNPPPGY